MSPQRWSLTTTSLPRSQSTPISLSASYLSLGQPVPPVVLGQLGPLSQLLPMALFREPVHLRPTLPNGASRIQGTQLFSWDNSPPRPSLQYRLGLYPRVRLKPRKRGWEPFRPQLTIASQSEPINYSMRHAQAFQCPVLWCFNYQSPLTLQPARILGQTHSTATAQPLVKPR